MIWYKGGLTLTFTNFLVYSHVSQMQPLRCIQIVSILKLTVCFSSVMN